MAFKKIYIRDFRDLKGMMDIKERERLYLIVSVPQHCLSNLLDVEGLQIENYNYIQKVIKEAEELDKD